MHVDTIIWYGNTIFAFGYFNASTQQNVLFTILLRMVRWAILIVRIKGPQKLEIGIYNNLENRKRSLQISNEKYHTNTLIMEVINALVTFTYKYVPPWNTIFSSLTLTSYLLVYNSVMLCEILPEVLARGYWWDCYDWSYWLKKTCLLRWNRSYG